MFRLRVKCGKRWVLGRVAYATHEEAEARAQQMTTVGHKVKIEKTGF